MPRIGRMRHRLVLQSKSAVRDQYGHKAPTWSDVREIAADRRPMGGSERMHAEKVESMQRERVIVWYADDIDTTKRFRAGGTEADPAVILEILSVHNPDGRNRRLECVCAQTS